MQSFFDSILRAFRRYRRWFAAVFAVLGVAAAVSAVSTASSGGEPTVVAARTITSGTVLTESDLTVVRLPSDAQPEGAVSDIAAMVGRQVLRDISARETVREPDLFNSELASAAGTVKLPVHFSDRTAVSLLRAGQHIDVFGPDPSSGGFAPVAADVTVLAVPQDEQTGPLSAGGAELVVIQVNSDQAASISAAAANSSLSFALR